MLVFDELAWLVSFIILVILIGIQWRQNRGLSYILCFSIFWVYFLVLIQETLFPIPLDGYKRDVMREQGITFMSQVNIIPFYFGQFAQPESIFRNAILNILLTIPFGFGINFIVRLKTRDFIWITFLGGIGIEATQLVISLGLGFPYRIIDINDFLFNATGILIGYSFFRLFAWLYITITQRLGIEHKGLPAYVHDVVSQIQ